MGRLQGTVRGCVMLDAHQRSYAQPYSAEMLRVKGGTRGGDCLCLARLSPPQPSHYILGRWLFLPYSGKLQMGLFTPKKGMLRSECATQPMLNLCTP